MKQEGQDLFSRLVGRGKRDVHGGENTKRDTARHVRTEPDLDPLVEHVGDPRRPAPEVEVRRRAVRDPGTSGLDQVHLVVCQVYTVREDSVGAEEAELVVDGGVGRAVGEKGCRRGSSASMRGSDGEKGDIHFVNSTSDGFSERWV